MYMPTQMLTYLHRYGQVPSTFEINWKASTKVAPLPGPLPLNHWHIARAMFSNARCEACQATWARGGHACCHTPRPGAEAAGARDARHGNWTWPQADGNPPTDTRRLGSSAVIAVGEATEDKLGITLV